MLTLYFSRTRGNKLDTKEMAIKQRTTADLLQQKPHVEFTDSKTSAASSDKDRLYAGISTFGLQSKRSRAEKLIRERKKREGTGTVEKSPRKTPPYQVKGTAGSCGGVKRPHSDSSTPFLEKQKPKNPGAQKCRLRHVRKVILESSWQSFIGIILMQNWMKPRVT